MRHVGKSRRQLFEEIERTALAPLPSEPFEYAEWKTAKVHPDYHVEVDKAFYSVPHRLIGRQVDVRLTYRAVEPIALLRSVRLKNLSGFCEIRSDLAHQGRRRLSRPAAKRREQPHDHATVSIYCQLCDAAMLSQPILELD